MAAMMPRTTRLASAQRAVIGSLSAFRRSIASAASPFRVSPPPPKRIRGSHWADDKGRSFKNPWDSYQDQTLKQAIPFIRGMLQRVSRDNARDMPRVDELVPRTTPTWGRPEDRDKMKATWMGHASYLVEMPPDNPMEGGRGVTILFDPAWSKRASPVQFFGPERYQKAAATVDEIPEIDIICLSHNHYDHQDTNTLTALYERFADRPPLFCVGLNGSGSLSRNIPREKIVEMDWWDEREITVEGKGKVVITCTPAQHMSKRSAFDTAKALWVSYAVKAAPSDSTKKGYNLWFGGDTGYRDTKSESHDPNDNLDLPFCPAFKEVGERLGPFSLALIPIGAYEPRSMVSSLHASPLDAVRIFQDVSKESTRHPLGKLSRVLGTGRCGAKLLKSAREALGVTEEQFGVPVLGETRAFEP